MTTTTHPYFDSVLNAPEGGTCEITRSFAGLTLGAEDDVAKVAQVPRGRRITNPFIQSGDFDSGAAHLMSLELTDGSTTKVLIDQTNIGQAGGLARPSKAQSVEDGLDFVVPGAGWWLQVRCTTAAGGAQAAALVVGFGVGGHYDTGAI